MEPIRSIDNPAVRRLRSLHTEARSRRELGLAVAEGPHLAAEALKAGLTEELWATPEALGGREAAALLKAASAKGLKPRLLSAGLLKKVSELPAPQGWLAVVKTRTAALPSAPSLCLALDGIQDPGNLGTLLRSAWAAQASLYLGPGCADPWSPKVLRAGVGAQFQAPFEVCGDLAAGLRALRSRGVQVLAAAPRAPRSYLDADLCRPTCLVLGAEGPGLSADVLEACEASLQIPYPGTAESLNVAVTGTLLLFEALRQRRKAR